VTPANIVERAFGGDVSRETHDRLAAIVARVTEENAVQNLVSAASLDAIWTRHIADSVQLLRFAKNGPWLDLGTGAGFPGLIVAAFCPEPIILCEARRLRADFLARVCAQAGFEHVTVACCKVERLATAPMTTISARAFAPLDKLFALSHRFSTEKTCWVLPKGQSAAAELELVRATWHGHFRLEPSVTDPTSSIIIAEDVRPKMRSRR
jgi:16S rRNA (guanine527-N7)-methyltransferase